MIEIIQTFLAYFSPILGFTGTVLIFFFGVPRKIDTGGKGFLLLEKEDEDEKIKIEKYKFWGNVGLLLIALGFWMAIVTLILQNYVGH